MSDRRHSLGFSLVELMMVLAIIGILSAVALPQYQLFVAKSQTSRLMSETASLKKVIDTCLYETRLVIGTAFNQCNPTASYSTIQADGGNAAPEATPMASAGVPMVSLGADGASTIEGTFGNRAATVLLGLTITWRRDVGGNWECRTNVPQKYVASGCAP